MQLGRVVVATELRKHSYIMSRCAGLEAHSILKSLIEMEVRKCN